jgi:glycosyltransferase involved in cell wall biosynthesis
MWNHLPEEAQSDEVNFLWASPKDRFRKWGKLISYYPQYMALTYQVLSECRHKYYDLIVAWESKLGFPIGIERRVLEGSLPPLLVLAFAYKGVATHFPAFSREVVQGITHMTVASPGEVDYYQQILRVPAERITFCAVGWHDICKGIRAKTEGGYIFAPGRSCRDYQTFLRAMDGFDAQAVIATRRFVLKGMKLPHNIRVQEYMPENEYARYLVQSSFVVLPLQNVPFAAGIETIVQAMSAGKAVVATNTMGTAYYVEDGVTGVLVPPYDAAALREECTYLLKHPALCTQMGRNARERYERCFTSEHAARSEYAIMQRVGHQGM